MLQLQKKFLIFILSLTKEKRNVREEKKNMGIINRIPRAITIKQDITNGLVNRWPLISNTNDIISGLNMTNMVLSLFPPMAHYLMGVVNG